MKTKNQLRKKILIERQHFDIYKYHVENELIIENVKIVLDSLHNDFNAENNKIIKLKAHDIEVLNPNCGLGNYLPLKGEPDLTKIMIHSNWTIALPKIDGSQIKFVYYKIGDKLENTEKKIQQPISDVELTPGVIIAPGLAYSLKGYRLGFGGGHYDRYLAKKNNLSKPIIKIGVCFNEFLLEYLPQEKHDIKFDYIITDKIILKL